VSERPDTLALVAGAAIAALGVVLLVDRAGGLELDFGWFGAALAATLGVILLVSGLIDPRD
jgi:hypothetical protein